MNACTRWKAGAVCALALPLTLAALPACAGPADYVLMPIVEEGEREIDFKAGQSRDREGSRSRAESLGLGWAGTSWWFTEVYAKWHHEPGEPHRFDAWEWENRFQLTETGRHALDVGLLVEIERPQNRDEGYELRWGLLLQAEPGNRLQANLNLLLQRQLRAARPSPAELGYQWQLKFRWQRTLEPGLQGFGNLGPWTHWSAASAQSHSIGPAVFGRAGLGEHRTLAYNAAWLSALGPGPVRCTLRLQAELEF